MKAIAFYMLSPFFLCAQSSLIDSLSHQLPTTKEDSNKVILLNELAWELKMENPELARFYLDSALILANRLGFKKGAGSANNYRGVVEDIHGNRELAIQFFQKALTIRRRLGDRKGVASLYNNIGNVRENLGDYVAALDNYQKSLRIREETEDTVRMLRSYYNIGILHDAMGNYPEALDFILRYLQAAEQKQDSLGIANAYNVMGNIKTELERFEEASAAYEKALSLHRRLGNNWESASVLNNLANLKDAVGEDNYKKKKYEQALPFFREALKFYGQALSIRLQLEDNNGEGEIYNNLGYLHKNFGSFFKKTGRDAKANQHWNEGLDWLNKSFIIREKLGDKAGIMEVYNGMADIRRRQNKFEAALLLTQRYLDIAREINDKKFIQNGLKDLARIYYATGKYQTAYQYRKQYDEWRYNRFNERRLRTNARREALYGDRKKQFEIDRQQQELKLQDAALKQANTLRNSLVGGAMALILLAVLLYNRNRIKTKANRELEEKNKIIGLERQRSEELLLNILPVATAEELKQHGKAKAKRFDSVTVLFTDFKSFTKITEQMPPEELVAKLDECFRAFDDIVSRCGIEKIKTIGDSYMCAGGLPTPNETHPENVVKAALEMQVFMDSFGKRQQAQGLPGFETRIGIHTGPVVAGIVGSKKFAYDIWGDTVNMAARMEESGETGKVNISQSTFKLVKKIFRCTHRGKILAKNKGEVDMYFVESNC